MGGNPDALAVNGAFTAHVFPGSTLPLNVSVPVQPAPPPSGPVATKYVGTVEGVFVTPGLNVATPVGAAGVPPQVQNVSPWPAVALPVVAKSPTAVAAITSATARHLIVSCSRRWGRFMSLLLSVAT